MPPTLRALAGRKSRKTKQRYRQASPEAHSTQWRGYLCHAYRDANLARLAGWSEYVCVFVHWTRRRRQFDAPERLDECTLWHCESRGADNRRDCAIQRRDRG